jgi:two-component system, chemotaxis family, CheB/CheR fusion protein
MSDAELTDPNDCAAVASGAETGVEQLYIAGVGASAGGLEALERLFRATPADTGVAFVVIQHLSPDFKSLMDELLARHTKMPIYRVEDGMAVRANSIYLLPPRKEMIISGGKLLLTDKDPQQDLSLPIDHFFRSLAQDAGPRAIAIVLSGTGSDGSRGIRDIHEAGGLVLAQSEETAKFDGMPRSALDTGVVEATLSPEEMPQAIGEHVHRRSLGFAGREVGRPDGEAGHGVEAIFKLLRDEYGIDFSHYKPNTVARRIERRLSLNQSVDLDDYVERLRNDPQELNSLYRDLLIGVTRFFRDRESFDRLEKDVIPDLLARKRPGDEIRFWVAGCATGEEAYSIAILLHERLQLFGRPMNVKIFATDVHGASLEVASAGVYDEDALSEVKPSRLATYFTKKQDGYHILPEIRQMIVFARHNVIKDAPFTKIDLISCRNLLIYFQPAAQKKALSLFHFGLRTGGVLFLGPSESPGELAPEFETLDEHWKIYRKRRDIRLPADLRLPLSSAAPHVRVTAPAPAAVPLDAGLLSAYDRLLEEHMPPGLLITDRRQLVHSFSGAGQFLSQRDGRPTSDILDLVEGDLKLVLAGSLQRAAKEQAPVIYTGVRIETPAGDRKFRLTVKPLLNRHSNLTHFFIALEDLGAPPAGERAASEIDASEASREQLNSLEAELRHTRENLQATIEELETSNEELQASNEELVASNEELQSTNEELHSVNEELYTVNAEYQKKIAELTELTDDMDNLLRSTDIGTIFLDQNLCIRKFTPQIGRAFDLLPQDVGRRIDSFSHNIVHPGLLEDVTSVLKTGRPVEKEVRHRHGNWFFLRILPYRSHTRLEGAVLTLIDISLLKRAESRLEHLSAIVESADDAIIGMDLQGTITTWNHGAERLYGYGSEEVIGKPASILRAMDDGSAAADWPPEVMDRIRAGQPANAAFERVRRRKDGTLVEVMMSFSAIRDSDGTLVGISNIVRDVSERKQAERARQAAEEEAREAVRRRDQFIAMLSHELRNPMAAVLNACGLLDADGDNRESVETVCRTIGRQARHMARLLDDLLDVSRMARDKIEIRKQPIDLRQTARDAFETVQPLLRKRRLDLRLQLPDEPVCVDGDPARLQQVQVNLLSNAIKYTPDGGEISLSLRQKGDEAVIRVRDTGVGIPVEMREKVFDLFVQLNRAADVDSAGMGVGLTLVRALVRLHGGNVSVDGAPGQGSEFTVRLPAIPADRLPPPRAETEISVQGIRVVLVEDIADIRAVMQRLLKSMGCEVEAAENGLEALRTITRVRPDVALIDIGLPELDGYEVARRIRARADLDAVRLIAVTGFGQEDDRRKALEAGFDAHLVKPVDLAELRRLLRFLTTRSM